MFARGFHPSAVAGAVGAATAACSLLRLSADTTAVALGLAASQSSGLLSFEEDPSHMMKSLQTGVAARNGVLAAVLAAAGFRGSKDTLDGPHSAIRAFGGETADPAPLLAELGTRYEVSGTSIKRHACCGQTHAAVDGLLDIMAAESLRPDEIDHIATEISTPAVHIIDGNPLWTHNIQYILALTAHEGRVGPEHFVEPWTSNPDIRKLAGHVTVAGSAELTTRFPAAKGANVEVAARGTTFRRRVPAPVGHPSVPLTPATLHDKFVALAEPSLPEGRAERLFQALQDETTLVSELAATFRALGSPA
jgi:2-methylcitrate dehydratase PrpD